jgi:hypothetical protein
MEDLVEEPPPAEATALAAVEDEAVAVALHADREIVAREQRCDTSEGAVVRGREPWPLDAEATFDRARPRDVGEHLVESARQRVCQDAELELGVRERDARFAGKVLAVEGSPDGDERKRRGTKAPVSCERNELLCGCQDHESVTVFEPAHDGLEGLPA